MKQYLGKADQFVLINFRIDSEKEPEFEVGNSSSPVDWINQLYLHSELQLSNN